MYTASNFALFAVHILCFDGLKAPLASRLKSVGWGTKRDIFYTTYRKCSGARQDERAEKQELPAHMEGFEIEYAPRENGR